MDLLFAECYLNERFSDAKKRNKIMKITILEPELAILDETDSGHAIDVSAIIGARRDNRDLVVANRRSAIRLFGLGQLLEL
jgi:Fe-S cluster assembly ATP-binding protein